jgi:DNA-binding winged helix-turn-helix (wHTH) protein/TolB-like protein
MNSGRFRFGLFEFDVATRELRRDGVLRRLQAQPAQVLSCLIQRAGQTVSREDLRKSLWGEDTFVDFDRGLNFCMSQIRSALDDDSTTPRYIRTLPRQGYQFIAPIEQMLGPSSSAERGLVTARSFPANKFVWAAVGLCLLLGVSAPAWWFLRSHPSKPSPTVAVVRFDNETNDVGMSRFSDGLTDNVVEQLTSQSNGRYSVIGNARILRLPRDQRDLNAISSALHAGYVVLGQVQGSGTKTRILAHLIRLPDETHLWVARMDRSLDDPLSVEAEAAQKIAAEFSERLIKDSSGSPLPPVASH